MAPDDYKAREERCIFEVFAASASLRFARDSLTQPNPPDILCAVDGLGQVAFELVQLDGEEELSRMSDFRDLERLWIEVTHNLATEIQRKHRNAQIDVIFQPDANQRVRRQIFDRVTARLGDLPDTFTGELFVESGMPVGLKSARLRRFDIDDGPKVMEISGSRPVRVDLTRIDAKIAHYHNDELKVRTELLAYSRWGLPFSDQDTGAENCLVDRFPAGIFSRAWIFELTSRRIVARWPEVDPIP